MSTSAPTHVTLRQSRPGDSAEITRLATIDSAPVPTGPLLLAEVDGHLRAALATEDGHVIADPFSPSLALVALLREFSRPRAGARPRRLGRPPSSHRGLKVLSR
ncbi:MAG: hypothetical protein QOH12_584 [Solirubrobacteraceae bacterium]|nr:hypothetical protein [Solirubrobacteraceae bacterium]